MFFLERSDQGCGGAWPNGDDLETKLFAETPEPLEQVRRFHRLDRDTHGQPFTDEVPASPFPTPEVWRHDDHSPAKCCSRLEVIVARDRHTRGHLGLGYRGEAQALRPIPAVETVNL